MHLYVPVLIIFALVGACTSLGGAQINKYCAFNETQRRIFIECYAERNSIPILGLKFTEAILSCMIGRGGSLHSLLDTYCAYRTTPNVLASGIHCLQVNPMALYLSQITEDDKVIMRHASDVCNKEATGK